MWLTRHLEVRTHTTCLSFSATLFLFGHVGLPAAPVTAATHTRALLKGSPSRTPRSQRHNAQTNAPAVQTPTSTLKQSCATWHSRLARHCPVHRTHQWRWSLGGAENRSGPANHMGRAHGLWIRACPCLVTPTYTGGARPAQWVDGAEPGAHVTVIVAATLGREVPRQPQAPESGRMLM